MASLLSTPTAEDTTDHSLPSFTTFTTELDPSWDYYDRNSSERNTIISADVISSPANANYTRPWEMESKDAVKGFEPFPKLPSFQSQFHVYNDAPLVPEPSLPQPVPVPVSPSTITSPLNGSLTQLTPIHNLAPLPPHSTGSSFHTLTTVQTGAPPPPRTYPLVPAPIQARDIPTIQQQYLDERHIQLYQPIGTFSPAQNIVTVVQKNDGHNGMQHHPNHHHQTAFQPAPVHVAAPVTMMETHGNGNGTSMGFNGSSKGPKESVDSPMRSAENRKKERRKIRASSIESSADSEGSAMDLGDMSSGQVSAVSSTANFKSPMGNPLGHSESQDSETGEKGLKQKKRKRCGECVGCQRKDNCGDCAPCRNDKSHQICKQRRCEKLTDKKLIYGADGTLIRGESKRGRGKGRGSGRTSFRGRKSLKFAASAASPRSQAPAASVSPQPASVPQQSPNTNTSANPPTNGNGPANGSPLNGKSNGQMQQQQHVVHQQQTHHIQATTTIHAIKDDQQQPMAPMAFYPTWQAATDPSQGWQNQFIQQIPQNTTATATIAPLNTIEFQPQSYAYPTNGYVQTSLGFDPNYGRSYAAPTIQRYEFQASNQINQVALQNVSFAPTAVTYAGQVATGPSPILLSNGSGGQQSISMAGNDLPGCPRVSSVPPPSLSYNGYSGEVSGKPSATPERNSSTPNSHMSAMNPPPVPQVTQSPGRQQESNTQNPPQFSPNHQQQIQHSPHPYGGQAQQPSPNPHLNNVANYAAATPSPSGGEWDWSNGGGSSGDMYNQQSNGAQGERLNLNTRLKTMILTKNDGGHSGTQGSQHHMSSVELSPPPSNGSAHGNNGPGNGAGSGNNGHFSIIKNVC